MSFCRNRTDDLEVSSPALWPTELVLHHLGCTTVHIWIPSKAYHFSAVGAASTPQQMPNSANLSVLCAPLDPQRPWKSWWSMFWELSLQVCLKLSHGECSMTPPSFFTSYWMVCRCHAPTNPRMLRTCRNVRSSHKGVALIHSVDKDSSGLTFEEWGLMWCGMSKLRAAGFTIWKVFSQELEAAAHCRSMRGTGIHPKVWYYPWMMTLADFARPLCTTSCSDHIYPLSLRTMSMVLFQDFSHIVSVTIPLNLRVTIPKAKWQKIDSVKATARF